jgi:hypothetical protein
VRDEPLHRGDRHVIDAQRIDQIGEVTHVVAELARG